MENLIIVGFVFALGVLIFSLMQYFEARHATHRDLNKNQQATPPLKRTISGPDPLEEIQVDFQQRVDTWRRTQMSRWSTLKETADGISGQRYRPDPEPWKEVSSHAGQDASYRVPQQFKLLG